MAIRKSTGIAISMPVCRSLSYLKKPCPNFTKFSVFVTVVWLGVFMTTMQYVMCFWWDDVFFTHNVLWRSNYLWPSYV